MDAWDYFVIFGIFINLLMLTGFILAVWADKKGIGKDI